MMYRFALLPWTARAVHGLAYVSLLAGAASCGNDTPRKGDAGATGLRPQDGATADSGANGGGRWGGDSGVTSSSNASGGDACAHADVSVTRHPPTVWILADRGLKDSIQSETIYSLLRTETVGGDGIVTELQSEIRFGFALTGAPADAPTCPNLVTVDPALDNHTDIETTFPAESGSSAQDPLVYYGLKHVLERVEAVSDPVVRRSHAVIVFVRQQSEGLCLPELVEFGWPVRAANELAAEADDGLLENLADLGVRTYVFSSNIFDDPSVTQRLNRMAELGASGHDPFLVGDGVALGNALREITSSLVSCEVSLQGKVMQGRECTGEVTINGEAVPCDDANGWRLTGPSSLEFVGDACDALQQQPDGRVRARFPCDVVTLY